jgi:hypothetical protein
MISGMRTWLSLGKSFLTLDRLTLSRYVVGENREVAMRVRQRAPLLIWFGEALLHLVVAGVPSGG